MLTKHVPYNHQNIIPHMIFFVSHMFGTLISHIKTHKKGNSVRNNHQKRDVHPWDSYTFHLRTAVATSMMTSLTMDICPQLGSLVTQLPLTKVPSQPCLIAGEYLKKGLAGSKDSFQMFPARYISYNGQRSFRMSQTNSCGFVSNWGIPQNAKITMLMWTWS